MSSRMKKFLALLLLACIFQIKIKTIISISVPEIPLSKGIVSSLVDVVQKTSKIVKRGLHEELKNNVKTALAFIDEHVATTNEFRAKHQVNALDVDYQLCIDAEEYAKVLADKSRADNKITVAHSGKDLTGENILGGQNKDKTTGKFTAEHWYQESKIHDWTKNVFDPKTGHFTQMVWKETTTIGVGKVDLDSTGPGIKNISIVVARYMPVGNWAYESSFKANVFPPI